MAIALLSTTVVGMAWAESVTLSKDRYLDKSKGAWVGQMVGVCFGAPYEFEFCGKIMDGPLKPWKPERIAGAIGQDDCYVEMTFLKALEDHGLDITFEQAGKAFGESRYDLWHANKFGRVNIRQGIMPPLSGHPDNNSHSDDIDFQIEADLFGILCPGLPQECNRLCNIFGHIMNYGDGVYGGMFVAGMYTAAYFEDSDVAKVVDAGLACIPAESRYHKCISDVIQWHAEDPNDWRVTWKKIEDKWQDDTDCIPGNPVNIDAKLNGAYIVMGLLYGDGDLLKTLEVSTRCGQDNDCNPSSAAGVLCCMKGFSALAPEWTSGLAQIENTNFSFTNYSFNSLIPACQRMTEAIIQRVGGKVTTDAYEIPVQAPKPMEPLEQWNERYSSPPPVIPRSDMRLWSPDWKVVACGVEMQPGLRDEMYGRKDVLLIHPVNKEEPAVIAADLKVPAEGNPKLSIEVASDRQGDFALKVLVVDKLVKEELIDTHGEWKTVEIDMEPYSGKTVNVRIENCANGWQNEAAYLGRIVLK